MTTREKDIRFDYSKLRGRIVEKYGSVANYCNETGRDKATFYTKLTTGGFFKQETIIAIAQSLDIPEAEYIAYFFTPVVVKS